MKKSLNKIYNKDEALKIEKEIISLGDDAKFTKEEFLNIRLFTTIFIFVIVLYVFDKGYIYAPFISIIYYYLFHYIFITKKINERTSRLDKEALEFFEILSLTLESGRNLEQSLRVTSNNVSSELSNEFKRALCEMDYGKSLMEVLSSMKQRIPSAAINNIILNIIETNQFGNSILDTLYNEVNFLREKQLLEIKGQINKIPNKISVISVIFIVPLIICLILGPYLIEIIG